MFAPESSSVLQQTIGWLVGRRPEFIDPRVVSQSEGREVTRVRTVGFVDVSFNTLFKDTKRLGYDLTPRGVHVLSEFPLALPSSVPADRRESTVGTLPPINQKNYALQATTQEDDDNLASEEPPSDPDGAAAYQGHSGISEVSETLKQSSTDDVQRKRKRLFQFFGSSVKKDDTERTEGEESKSDEETELTAPPIAPPRVAVRGRLPPMETLAEDEQEEETRT